jgi:hypothetical protein
MKTILYVLALLTLVGCASKPAYQQSAADSYAKANKAKIDNGTMLWSDYYKGIYDAEVSQPKLTTGAFLLVLNDLIDKATDYESGKITEDTFASARREAKGKFMQIDSEYALKAQQIEATSQPNQPYAYKPYIRKSRPAPQPANMPTTTNCSTYGNQTSCTTY